MDLAACLSALHPDPEARRTAGRAMVANLFEEKVMFHRAAHEPAWRPPITLEGADALASTLARGGAVLWVAPVTFATLVVKMVLADAGFRVLHLSRVGHGGGRSRVGIRLNNDWQNIVEERFVTRIVMPRQGSSASTVRALKKGLESGGVVSITAIDIADRPVERDFLGGTIRLATGAPRLAERHGASLFAVLTTRDRGRRFRVRLVPLGADTVEARTTLFCDLFASALRHSPDLLRRGMTSYREAPRDALR